MIYLRGAGAAVLKFYWHLESFRQWGGSQQGGRGGGAAFRICWISGFPACLVFISNFQDLFISRGAALATDKSASERIKGKRNWMYFYDKTCVYVARIVGFWFDLLFYTALLHVQNIIRKENKLEY